MILAVVVVGIYAINHYNNYRGVSCIDCFRRTNYLINTGQLNPEQYLWEEERIILDGETIEEMALQLMDSMPWMCETCAYRSAENMLNPERRHVIP